MTDEETLRYLQDLQRQRSTLDAHMTQALAHFHRLRQDYADGKYASDEVAAALHWSPRTASSMVSDAVQLMERLPDTVRELKSGRLDMPKARAILDWTDTLPVEQAREIASRVHDWSLTRTTTALRQKLSREVAKIDPQAAEARRQRRAEQRQVTFCPDPDGMATLTIYDTAERLRAVYDLLDYLARKAKAAGDPRTLDALRADAFATLLLGTESERVHVELRVTVPASVLAGTSNAPGWLHGYGPITAETVWELAHHSKFWRRLITDPVDGTVLEVSQRRPSAALREYIHTRTPTCVGVGCARPAESCETDHTIDYAQGGATAAANLGPTCRRHNLIKLEGGWTLAQPKPGHYVWTTPAGTIYEVEPEPIVDPTPDPQPVPDDDQPPF